MHNLMQYIPTLPTHSCGVSYSHFDKDTELFIIIRHTHSLRVAPHWNCISSHVPELSIQAIHSCNISTDCFLAILVPEIIFIIRTIHGTSTHAIFTCSQLFAQLPLGFIISRADRHTTLGFSEMLLLIYRTALVSGRPLHLSSQVVARSHTLKPQ